MSEAYTVIMLASDGEMRTDSKFIWEVILVEFGIGLNVEMGGKKGR